MKRSEAILDPDFWKDLAWWIRTDKRTALRIVELVDAILTDPFIGIGKPEPLKYEFAGCWSRRLTNEHRVVYAVKEQSIYFLQARFHY